MNPIWLNAVRASGSVTPWWLEGGISPTNAVAVYQPIGAASLSASYTNLVNPGTFDAALGVAPTWASGTGWEFNGTNQWLNTGVIPTPQLWTVIWRYDNVPSISSISGIGCSATSGRRFLIRPNNTLGRVNYVSGDNSGLNVAPELLSGVLAIAGNRAYRNGVDDGLIPAGVAGDTVVPFLIGATSSLGTPAPGPANFLAHRSQAIAIYSATLTASQVAAVSAAMAAL